MGVLGLRCCTGFSLVGGEGAVAGLLSSCSAWASHCGSFSCCRAQALGRSSFSSCGMWLSSGSPQALEHRLSSCGTQASVLHSTRDLPGPGIKPVSLALAGGFSTTELPIKPPHWGFNVQLYDDLWASFSMLITVCKSFVTCLFKSFSSFNWIVWPLYIEL